MSIINYMNDYIKDYNQEYNVNFTVSDISTAGSPLNSLKDTPAIFMSSFYYKVIYMSESAVNYFTKNEILATVGHEYAHLMKHSPELIRVIGYYAIEYDADENCTIIGGKHKDLVTALVTISKLLPFTNEESITHPSSIDRINRLERYL